MYSTHNDKIDMNVTMAGSTTSHSVFLPITDVQDLVERQLSGGTDSSWSRPLMFRACLVHSAGEKPDSRHFVEHNLLDYTTNVLYKNCLVYFDVQQHAPLEGSNKKISAKDPAWINLCTEIMRAGKAVGMSLIANGEEYKGSRKIICSHGVFCDKRTMVKKKDATKKAEYRPKSLNADYRNVRRDGRQLARRTSTFKPQIDEGQRTCKLKLVFGCDEDGFYMRCGVGCGEHCGHAPPLDSSMQTTRKRLLQHDDIETLNHLGQSQANAGVGRNFMFAKNGTYMSNYQIRYLYSDPWQLPKSTDGSRPVDDIALDVTTPPCVLLDNFRKRNDVCYSCLFSDAATLGEILCIIWCMESVSASVAHLTQHLFPLLQQMKKH